MKQLLICGIFMFTFLYTNAQANYKPGDPITITETKFYDLDEARKAPAGQVQILDLSMKKLTTLPQEVFSYPGLTELNLAYNYWSTLPDGFGKLQKLEVLDLSGNYNLKKIPESLAELQGLDVLILRDHVLPKSEITKLKNLLPNTRIIEYPYQLADLR